MLPTIALLLVAQKPNVLSADERKDGWRLLFDGKSLKGWRDFPDGEVKPGWRVGDGALVCADPHTAGDIVTDGEYDWFTLELDYRLSPGGNSGVMFHVADEGGATWQSGPEIQLHDREDGPESQKSGWLYGLYRASVDAVRPEGEWNHLRLVVTPQGCSTELNGVPYVQFVLGSEDFRARVARSKFGTMPLFAKSEVGRIALQGDHGVVSFRNLKLRPFIPAPVGRL